MPVRTVQPEVSTVTVACGQRVFTSTLNSSTHFNPQDIYLKRYGAPGHDIEFVRKCLLTRDSPTNDPSFQPISLWIGKSWNKVRQSNIAKRFRLKKDQFFVTVTDQATTKKTTSVSSKGQTVQWDQRFDAL